MFKLTKNGSLNMEVTKESTKNDEAKKPGMYGSRHNWLLQSSVEAELTK